MRGLVAYAGQAFSGRSRPVGLDVAEIAAEIDIDLACKIADGMDAVIHDTDQHALPDPVILEGVKCVDVLRNHIVAPELGIILG
jgi:hypothetical protein